MNIKPFICPECETLLSAEVLIEMISGGYVAELGPGIPIFVNCPHCDCPIPTTVILSNKKSHQKKAVSAPLAFIIGIAVVFCLPIVYEAQTGKQIGLWSALGIGIPAIFAGVIITMYIIESIKKIFK